MNVKSCWINLMNCPPVKGQRATFMRLGPFRQKSSYCLSEDRLKKPIAHATISILRCRTVLNPEHKCFCACYQLRRQLRPEGQMKQLLNSDQSYQHQANCLLISWRKPSE